MNRSDHTPGPWQVSSFRKTPLSFTIETVAGSEDPDDLATRGRYFIIADTRDSLNADANARLLAAAPELLTALEEVTKELADIHIHHYPKCKGGCPAEYYLNKAKAVIAKAKGISLKD